MRYIILSYDEGYLLSGKIGANYSKYNWIIKTDINGEVLWDKMIGDGIHAIVLIEMAMNTNGELFLCGSTQHEDPSGDPIIIKLNPCGEKEWCKVLYSPNHHDFADRVCNTPDGGCAVTLNLTGTFLWNDRICLAKFSSEGDMEWKKCYNSPDSLLGNEDDANLILTPDNGFLISGWCYYTDPTGTLAWLHPYYIKTDSLGNFEWELISEKETGDSGGQAWQTTVGPDSQYYYSSTSHYYHNGSGDTPALLKFDLQGNLIDIYDLAAPDEIGKLFDARFINDSLLAASASWGVDSLNSPMAVIIDTLGNIKDMANLLVNDYMSFVRVTFDNKLLFYTETETGGEFDVYLFKLNQNLESDTLYTMPFTYDSLCPYQIVSDTIVQDDCELIVGIEEDEEDEEKGGRGEGERMVIWPNPAGDVIHVRMDAWTQVPFPKDVTMTIYDIYGRTITTQTPTILPSCSPAVLQSSQEITIDVSGYPPGLYIITITGDRQEILSGKFVICR